jgi:hypothetical protein
LFINDVASLLNNERCVCKLYADDVKLYTTMQIDEDYTNLQQKLDALNAWSNIWQLTISHNKCAAMQIRSLIEQVKLHLGSSAINATTEFKDLGVLVDSNPKFTLHINDIVSQTHARKCHGCTV